LHWSGIPASIAPRSMPSASGLLLALSPFRAASQSPPAPLQTSSTKCVTLGSTIAQGSQERYGLFSTRSEGLMVKRTAIYFLLPVALACGALFPTQGNAEESNGIAALKSWFEYLSMATWNARFS